MNKLASRLLRVGILFLLAPIWAFPLIDTFTMLYVEHNLPSQYYTVLSFDFMRFPMEFGTFSFLFKTGLFVTALSLVLKVVVMWQARKKSHGLEKAS